MRIQTNVAALSAQNKLAVTQAALQTSTTRLSSGFRINRAADDAAGLSIANQMRGDVRALQAAQRNASQASSVLQIADGATSTIATILDRMKELATQAASANTTDDARGSIQAEFAQLQAEIDRITESTKFQGQALLTGSFGLGIDEAVSTLDGTTGVSNIDVSGARAATTYTLSSAAANELTLTADGVSQTISIPAAEGKVNFDVLGVSFNWAGTDGGDLDTLSIRTADNGAATFRVGIGSEGSTINLSLGDLTTEGMGIPSSGATPIKVDTLANAEAALDALVGAYEDVNTVIGQIGAATNRLEFASTNLSSIIQNTMAAESTIRDADMAYEMMQFSKQNILAQAGTAMLAQANSLSQSVLQLLR